MARSIRIPFIADLKKVSSQAEVRALAANADLDRRFETCGPLINRVLMRTITGNLQLDGKPLPAVAPRGDAFRAKDQKELRRRLDPAQRPLWDDETLAALVAAVTGRADADVIGPAAQQAVGRLFVPTYVGDAESFAAARDLDDAVHSRNPIRRLLLHATGRLRRSRRLLAARVGGDLAGVHGTGIAVHNMVRGFQAMRELFRRGERPGADEVVKRCLFAPPTVVRQATAPGQNIAGEMRKGTVMLFELDKIRQTHPDAETVFMAGNWAECPALLFVPALYRAVWDGAIVAEKRS
jgi:hypothetical protein